MLGSVNLFQYGVVCGKIALSGCSFENMSIQVVVKIRVEKVFFSDKWSIKQVGMKISVQP